MSEADANLVKTLDPHIHSSPLGQPENEGDDRQSDQRTKQESTRHVVTYPYEFMKSRPLSHFDVERDIPQMGRRKMK
jgi:hypothetical protein